jgi:hypothetical protein
MNAVFAYHMGSDTYLELVKAGYVEAIAALHAASYGTYLQSPRGEQEEMFKLVWERTAKYQLEKQVNPG